MWKAKYRAATMSTTANRILLIQNVNMFKVDENLRSNESDPHALSSPFDRGFTCQDLRCVGEVEATPSGKAPTPQEQKSTATTM